MEIIEDRAQSHRAEGELGKPFRRRERSTTMPNLPRVHVDLEVRASFSLHSYPFFEEAAFLSQRPGFNFRK